MRFNIAIASLLFFLLSGCATGAYVSVDDLKKGKVGENAICRINKSWNLEGEIVELPHNCTLLFEKGGVIKNGTIKGNETKIKYSVPFIGEGVTITGCAVSDKRVIRDYEVFVDVQHTQYEIQTLFNISGGIRLDFSPGTYENVERIVISGDVDADFKNSTIRLKRDKNYLAECFYMQPWVDNHVNYVRIKNLKIVGEDKGFSGKTVSRRCIQLFYVSEVVLDNITIDKYYGGPEEYKSDASDLLDKTRVGTSVVAIMKYDKCTINNCRTKDINKEIFWCVPNNNPANITYFTNNESTNSSKSGSSSFFTLLDGRCVVKNNKVLNYNGSAFNAFCYDSEIAYNKFYDGKRSIAIDLSEGTMYRARNVDVHDNYCLNTKGLLAAYGEDIRIKSNTWKNQEVQTADRCVVLTVVTRGERTADGKYVGCENNPEQGIGSTNITIENNVCANEVPGKGYEVRFACVYGDVISFSNNQLTNLNVPVVQLVEGSGFIFKRNTLLKSKEGHYAELLVNKGSDVSVTNNSFSRNHIAGEMSYTVHVMKGEGKLTYKANRINTDSYNLNKNRVYVPCYVQDNTDLEQAEYFVDDKLKGTKIETKLDKARIRVKTNIVD